MGRLVKLVGSGIGLATEAYVSRKQAPSSSASASGSRSTADAPPDYSSSSRGMTDGASEWASSSANAPTEYGYIDLPVDRADELIAKGQAVPIDQKEGHNDAEDSGLDENTAENDEADWTLDDAVEEIAESEVPIEDNERQVDVDELVRSFVAEHPPPAYTAASTVTHPLPCPVVIPQRRPKTKSRGFIRAYAPLLLDCGIDQATFMQFLKSFHQASKASPVFDVLMVGAGIAGMVPGVIAMATSISVQVTVGVAKEVQSRHRSNSFLHQMNDKLFRPHGLYCLVMTYKPEARASHEAVDISKTIFKDDNQSDSKVREQLRGLRTSSAKTYGELELPEAAPLIFPALDAAAADATQDPQKKNRLKMAGKFIGNYFDKRAQASYAAENPGSSLAVTPPADFASRYSDPNHHVNSGSLVSLITGGAINPKALKDSRRSRGQSSKSSNSRGGLVRRYLKPNVLYLMVVNMPTEEEMEAAKASLAAMEAPA